MQLQPGDERYVTLDGALKTPLSLVFMMLFFMRGYAAWIISLTFVDDRARLLKFFYTTSEQFGLALLVGLPALVVFILVTQVKTDIAPWVSASFKALPLLLWCSWMVDGVLIVSLISQLWPSFSFVKALLLFGWLMAGWMLLFSRHLRRFISLVDNRLTNNE